MINPRVKLVKPLNDYRIQLTFENDEIKIFDVSPFLDKGVFSQLKDESVFNSVKPFLGAIQWNNGLDLGPDTLYLDSVPLTKQPAS